MDDASEPMAANAKSPRHAADYLMSMLDSMSHLARQAELRNSSALLTAARRLVEQESLYLTGRAVEPAREVS